MQPDEPDEPDAFTQENELVPKSSGWTDERRARHALLIHQWQPWRNSTGPRTPQGKAISSRNAYKSTSVRRALEVIAADLRAAARRARKPARA
jgi:hypothetical protein